MSKKTKKPNAKTRRMSGRLRRLKEKRDQEVEALVAQATKFVEPGSGHQTLGRGQCTYIKMSSDCSASRTFCFRRHADAQRAMKAAILRDAIDEGRLHELDAILRDAGLSG
ncbi:MAG: hypothetical protein CMN30_00275 [Sandaracinus sp.]|nr:hypothetical protein [Sandaracinus sp.]|tara:strand:- start:10591 stop:10923 length:333 start_codon:yes stop_codon:yes gene_type:complete